ncbi:MAG: hypothetical protein A2Y00_07420 [Omnitrophica WOR_2 bacterium GWF2_43_52]|nr:MAG: hypothetical protein A2Y01_01100 [Omnitrophica WOR_2 bacterium GWC2_44_8]OGX20249.1 MAG: hypothetical protein A2Y00_07420 [Omnitrophica WOR_2 bacterium GWF2_43_52]HAH20731.1 hypothetical protein [Candidatus Omnitrophota bacterium]HBG63599.1 hypothetical protein [Candidatus Omnitrophota bacterium]
MRKIRIAHVITRMDWGGSPDIVRILCDSLDPETFDAWLVIGKTEYPSAKTTEFLEKFKDKTIVIPQLKRDIDVLNDFLALVRLCLLLQRHRFDIVHTHTAKAGFLGRLAAKLAGVKKVIHTPHGNNFYGYFGALASKLVVMLEKFADYCTDITIVLTELEKKELIEYGVSRNKKIAVVKSGLEFEAYGNCSVNISQKKGELGIEDNSQNIVAMIGRLELVKGPEYFIKAAKLVLEKYPSVTFLMVGDGSLREKLEAKVGATTRVAPTAGKFIFLGWRDDVPELLQIIDIVALPSLNEAVGRILLEAGSCGIPVIASCVGGIPEVVKDGVTGILVPARNPVALANAIAGLLSDKEKRTRMGNAARDWVCHNFSAEKMSRDIAQVYSALVPDTKSHFGVRHQDTARKI